VFLKQSNVFLFPKNQGITLYHETETEITFLLCEDNDTEDLEATLYKLN